MSRNGSREPPFLAVVKRNRPRTVALEAAFSPVMPNLPDPPPLKPLHPDQSLSVAKLAEMERQSTAALEHSVLPGQTHSLKARADGTILEGHHRIYILRQRGRNVDALPREIIEKGSL